MTSRAMFLLGLTIAAGACAKKSQETDSLSPPPSDTVHTKSTKPAETKKPASDTTQVRMERPDTSQYGKEAVSLTPHECLIILST